APVGPVLDETAPELGECSGAVRDVQRQERAPGGRIARIAFPQAGRARFDPATAGSFWAYFRRRKWSRGARRGRERAGLAGIATSRTAIRGPFRRSLHGRHRVLRATGACSRARGASTTERRPHDADEARARGVRARVEERALCGRAETARRRAVTRWRRREQAM